MLAMWAQLCNLFSVKCMSFVQFFHILVSDISISISMQTV